MVEYIQAILFSSWVVRFILTIVFLVLTHWSLRRLKEYAGYALGFLMGIFFVLVYISLGGGAEGDAEASRETLNLFEVILATVLGLFFGAGIMFGLRFGTRFARGVALQIALYTALNLILLFLAIIEGPIAQRMIGIFALALGIASLFAMVIFPTHHSPDAAQAFTAQGATNPQPPAVGGSRLDTIRENMRNRNQ